MSGVADMRPLQASIYDDAAGSQTCGAPQLGLRPPSLAVSVVVYGGSIEVLGETLRSLSTAVMQAVGSGSLGSCCLTIVDNRGSFPEAMLGDTIFSGIARRVMRMPSNIGFGAGHNIGLCEQNADYVLVLNPDVRIDSFALERGIRWLEVWPMVAAIAPDVRDGNGLKQYLCRDYPSVFALLLRGFAPAAIRRLFARILNAYELRDRICGDEVVWDPPLISGCFMLIRGAAWRGATGFDPRYFLYFEDYDLCLRLAKFGRLVFLPSVKIVHLGGGAARKGLLHIGMFIRSAFLFFHTHGWRWR